MSQTLVACALRNTGTGWYVMSNSTHKPMNVASVSELPTCLKIVHEVGATHVVALTATVDETYAGQALRCGVSAGLDYSYVYLYSDTSSEPLDPTTVAAPSGNLWILGYLEI